MNGNIVWSPGVTLEDIEKQVIIKAFAHFQKNKSATARALDISVKTLDAKFEKYTAEDQEQERLNAEQRSGHQADLDRQRGTPGVPQYDTSASPRTYAGYGVESTSHAGPQPPVSVSQRTEVQGVLSPDVAGSSNRKASR